MQFNQTAYRTTRTTLRCDSQSRRNFSNATVWFFCKESNVSCEEISTRSSHVPNRTLLTKTGGGVSLSISHVSPHDAGVYWCGVADKDGRNRTALMKIHLEVENVTTFWRRPATGQDFSFFCLYLNDVVPKFICKGEDPSTCERLVNTTKPHGSPRFSMRDDKAKKNISVTMRAVTGADSGTYWCGEESASRHRSPTFLHRMHLRGEWWWACVWPGKQTDPL
ncbi:polymeric immunoglobulin receptor-like [Menidia menidia]